MSDKVDVGDKAPDFTLPTQSGQEVHLADLLKQGPVVLYFYPKDNTSGCTAEACAFRDSYEVFKDAGAEVVGVSSDSVESHQQFASQHHLPFILASDEGGGLRKSYGVPKSPDGYDGRVTYVIDRDGVVRHIFNSQRETTKHIDEALVTVQRITGQSASNPA